ncbi:nucleotidyltransferase domain-containing protein [Methanolobus sp.]|uniref:type VII toxin-antitoxin system MntA family adenylyltransferase antitoxin n=1 Tax=Methanolobus sp. TaxID=1874737 RepID=UPI0025CE58BA|nr:nucleotidyltransferase domain-containing protein [Methanolobus sp.]
MNAQTSFPEKERLISLLKEFFRAQDQVELVYLFGSVAEGKAGAFSDIDLGVYLADILTKAERGYKRIELISGLTSLLGSDRVDLLVLNDTPPVLSFEIIKPNVLIFERDSRLKVDVEQRIMSVYLDWKYYEDRMNRNLLKRITERGLA